MDTLMVVLTGLILFGVALLVYRAFTSRENEVRIKALDEFVERFPTVLSERDEVVRREFAQNRTEFASEFQRNREEATGTIKTLADSVLQQMKTVADLQKDQLDTFSNNVNTLASKQEGLLQTVQTGMEKIRDTVDRKLGEIQNETNQKLESMRQTVDEKLHKTLEERLGQSFQLVSQRLEEVHKGLGEMKTLATGVGDLKKVLSNVRARGALGEYQLAAIIEEILSPEQYGKNVATKGNSREQVEYAIKFPGGVDGSVVWLPVDSKFPLEKYQALCDAYEIADPDNIEAAAKELESSIKKAAKDIRTKYSDPPNTTEFSILFLPIEGLYAEVVKRIGLVESIQREHRVTVAGPVTMAAILNSLQMGFRTLAIQKKSGEVWNLLGAVKTEFNKFGGFLDGIQKSLDAASNKIKQATARTRAIERKLKDVETLPEHQSIALLGEAVNGDEDMSQPEPGLESPGEVDELPF